MNRRKFFGKLIGSVLGTFGVVAAGKAQELPSRLPHVDSSSLYTQYTIEGTYIVNENKKLKLCGVTHLNVYDWTAERIGKRPEYPGFGSPGPNWVLVETTYGSESVSLVDGNTCLYKRSGRYVFAGRG